MHPVAAFVAGYLACIVTVVPLALFFYLMRPWLQGFLSGAPVSILHLIGMRLRQTPVRLVMDAYISLIHSGTMVNAKTVESVYIANRHRILGTGDLVNLVRESPAKDASQQ
jgi:uncharacterized protein YqfA (UPF0365 family)